MLRRARIVCVGVAVAVCLGLSSSALQAGTIIKLSLGSDAPADIEFDGTTLSTVDDLIPATTGDQNTAIDYQDFLSGMSDVLLPIASFSLNGLNASGAASVFGGFLVIQDFTGGTFELYDPAPGNSLLLSGSLANSTLTGPIGPPATGALFTTSFAMVTGGSLAPLIDTNTLTVSMNLSSINNGKGLSVTGHIGPGPTVYSLDPFRADASVNIAADPAVPEPATFGLVLIGTLLAGISTQRRRT
jgi:PEP-CTERM motif